MTASSAKHPARLAPPQGRAKPAVPIVRPPALSSEALNSIVLELNEIFRSGTLDLHIKMGRVVIERLYRGDLAQWHARGPREISFRRLAARAADNLMVSASSLYRSVALCELVDRLGVSTWKHLTISHLRGVIGLPEQDQRRLLAAADSESWTVEHLETEKAKLRAAGTLRRGRPPLLPFIRTVHRLAKLIAEPQGGFEGLERLREISDTEAAELYKTVSQAKRGLEMVEAGLSARRPPKR